MPLRETWRTRRELDRELKALGRGRARGVRRAVQRGEAVSDPRDAELAIRLAQLVQRAEFPPRKARWFRWSWRAHLALLVPTSAAAIYAAVAMDERLGWLVAVLLVVAAANMYFVERWFARLRERAKRAEEANRAVPNGSREGV